MKTTILPSIGKTMNKLANQMMDSESSWEYSNFADQYHRLNAIRHKLEATFEPTTFYVGETCGCFNLN
jgi:hypothetical protein